MDDVKVEAKLGRKRHEAMTVESPGVLATVGLSKGRPQVRVPQAAMEALGLAPGNQVVFEVKLIGGELRIVAWRW